MLKIICLIVTILPFYCFAQEQPELKLDSSTNKYAYKKIVEIPEVSAADLHTRILSYGKDAKTVTVNTTSTIMFKYEFKLGAYKYVAYVETFEIKDNKYRYTLSDISYLLDASDDSPWKPVESVKKSDEILEKVNEILIEKLSRQNNEIIQIKGEDW